MKKTSPNDRAVVLDHFHLVNWFKTSSQCFSGSYTMKLMFWARTHSSPTDIKATENLKVNTDKTNKRARLQCALEFNQPLATAYYMKEKLRLLFDQADRNLLHGYRSTGQQQDRFTCMLDYQN